MTNTKQVLTETRDTINELAQAPDINAIERMQYKLMGKNLNGMLNIVLWLQNICPCKKAR